MIVRRAIYFFCFTTLTLFGAGNETATQKIKNEIAERYKRQLPSLQILDIELKPTLNIQTEPLNFISADFGKQNNFLRKEGSVTVVVEGQKKTQKKLFLRYKVDGFVALLKARVNIPKDTIVALDSVDFESVKFDWFSASPIDKNVLGAIEAKRLIPAGSSITIVDVQPISLVKKFSSVTAVIREDGLEVTFEATAQEDGNEGKIITIKNRHGKSFRAKIVSSDKVTVE